MVTKKILTFIFLIVVSFSLSGCLQVNTRQNRQATIPDGGFFMSKNKGKDWQQRTAILSTGPEARNFSLNSVSAIALDPSDPKVIYYGTVGYGLLYTYDRGISWQLDKGLGKGTISAIAVDPSDTCTIYASIGRKVFKTKNCNRSWTPVFTEDSAGAEVTAIAVDHFNSNNIYVTLARGDVLKSLNAGKSWQTIYRFEKKIKKFIINPVDSRQIYAIVDGKGLQKSNDSATSWIEMSKAFSDFKIGKNIIDVKLFKNNPNVIFVATKKGIIKSVDNGKTWEKLLLLPPEKKTVIMSIAVNPSDLNEIYYVSARTFYKSIDGGKSWATRPLPTTKTAKILLLDEEKNNILYLGIGTK